MIGSENPTFLSGETDLRGVFVAEGVRGQVAGGRPQGGRAVRLLPRHHPRRRPARLEYRARHAAAQRPAGEAPASETLEQNLKIQNTSNQMRQIERLQNRYNQGGQGGAAAKGFK